MSEVKTAVKFAPSRSAIVIITHYGQTSYEVTLKPVISSGQIEVSEVKLSTGEAVTGDEKYTIGTHAREELMAWFKKKLEPKADHITVTLLERVEIAFIVTILHYKQTESECLKKITPLGSTELRLLQNQARILSNSIVKAKIDQRATGHKLPSDYLQTLKRNQLVECRKEFPMCEEKRDFFSSVLSRAFAWKNGQVPLAEWKKIEPYRDGIRLAFSLEDTKY